MVFDCLHERGRDLRPLPLDERRAVLEDELMGR
jgi:ATP-dependent DNA ligase